VRVPEHIPSIPSADVQERVLAAIEWRKRGVFLARGLLGLRPSEARNASLPDYQFDPSDRWKDVLTVPKSKSNRYRLLPVPRPLAKWVREFRPVGNLHDASAEPTPLFDNPRGETGRWEASSERRILKSAMKICGVEYRPNEFLRHAFGTITTNRLLSEGYSEGDVCRMVMAIMGHTEAKTSTRYVRLATERMERVVRRGGDG
jgi:integrase